MDCVLLAIAFGSASSVAWLLNHRAELLVSSYPSTAHLTRRQRQLQKKARNTFKKDVDAEQRLLIRTAVARGDVPILQVLQEQGFLRRNNKGDELILGACKHSRMEAAAWLLSQGYAMADVNRLNAIRIDEKTLDWLKE